MSLTIKIPDDCSHAATRALEALQGYHVEITYRAGWGPDECGDRVTVEIAGFTPEGDLIARDVVDGFTGLGTSLFDVPTIRRVKVI